MSNRTGIEYGWPIAPGPGWAGHYNRNHDKGDSIASQKPPYFVVANNLHPITGDILREIQTEGHHYSLSIAHEHVKRLVASGDFDQVAMYHQFTHKPQELMEKWINGVKIEG